MAFEIEFPQLAPTAPHIIYTLLSTFLILYALFSEFIRNRLHLSEPPLALLVGVVFGLICGDSVGPIEGLFDDRVTQEISRIVVGLQVFTVGLELPAQYMSVQRHWRSLAILLGPVMTASWLITAGIIYGILSVRFNTALIIAATLSATDPVLSASVLGEAKFSSRVPKRLRRILSAESGCNDGTSFPFLYIGLYAVLMPQGVAAVKWWFIEIILWQCMLGIIVGALIGFAACRALKFSEARGYVQESTLLVFYFLLATLCIGVGSVLGLDDFLVCFCAGNAFCWDGWFAKRTHRMKLPSIIDLLLNSAMFVYFGALIPWDKYTGRLSAGKLIACLVLILLLRRIPAIMVMKPFMPAIRTYGEAIFAGHFGPMGVGALFLAIEARAVLETGTAEPTPNPPEGSPNQEAEEILWPIVCFIVLGSIVVHGCSALVMSTFGHFFRKPKERAPLLGAESDPLSGMANDDESLLSGHSSDEGTDENGAPQTQRYGTTE